MFSQQTYREIKHFFSVLNSSVQGKMVSDIGEPTAVAAKLLSILDTLSTMIDETPPLDQVT